MQVKQETASTNALMPALIAVGIINLVLVLPLWWRDGAWGSVWLIPELGVLPLLALWPGAHRARWLYWLLAILLALAWAAFLGDALVRAVFSRPLNILLDPWLLRAGFNLLHGSLGTAAAVTAAVLAAVGVLALTLGMRMLVKRVFSPVPHRACLPIAALAAAALMAIALAHRGVFVRPAIVDLVQAQSLQVRSTLAEREALIARATSKRMQEKPIPALTGRDVVLVFVESYGVSALDQSRYANVLNPVLAGAETRLSAAGLGAVSTRLSSPIRGGQSWLSHATVLGGQPVDNDYWYSLLLDSGQAFLTDDFRLTGHTPLVVAPAIVQSWPEARSLGFDAIYPAAALEYKGPSSGWVGIPDQYTLHRYSRRLRPRHDGPVFATLMLISSHAPWSPGPPLLQNWSGLDRENPWTDWRPLERDPLVYWRDTDRLRHRYPHSLGYSLEAVFTWAERDLPENALLIVLGDHQPSPLITGHSAGAEVPVHFLTTDASLLSRLKVRLNQATREGLALPRAELEYSGLDRLRFVLRDL